MTTPTRIYLVTPTNPRLDRGAGQELVEASHPNAALKAVTDGMYTVSVPTPAEVVRLMQAGVAVRGMNREMPKPHPGPFDTQS